MMQLHIERSDLAGPWIFCDGAWRSRRSFIGSYDHPAIESFMVEAKDCTLIMVRERGNGNALQGSALVSESPGSDLLVKLRAWPLNFQIVEIRSGEKQVRLHASARAAAPLFVTGRNGALQADWDAARLYSSLPLEVDFEAAAYTLAYFALPYSRRTIFSHIQHLTERSTAIWNADPGLLSIKYPEAAVRCRPREVHVEADVHEAFASLFGALLKRVAGDGSDPVAFEISGGLDSGVATMIGTQALGPDRVRGFGLLLPGDQKSSQGHRRDAIVEHCGIADTVLIAEGPLSRGKLAQVDPIVPWAEFYREAFLDLSHAVQDQNCRLLVRGLGGDEISELRIDELEPDATFDVSVTPPIYLTDAANLAAEAYEDSFDPAPPGPIPSSFCQAAAASTPGYLRRGIWLLYPYGDPEIVDLCRSLPKKWREDRHLQRSYLERAGLPEWVVRPPLPENFLPLRDLMFEGKSAAFVSHIFEKPLLADLGLVDPKLLRDRFQEACRKPELPGRTHLMQAATLETMLRTWHGASDPLGP